MKQRNMVLWAPGVYLQLLRQRQRRCCYECSTHGHHGSCHFRAGPRNICSEMLVLQSVHFAAKIIFVARMLEGRGAGQALCRVHSQQTLKATCLFLKNEDT